MISRDCALPAPRAPSRAAMRRVLVIGCPGAGKSTLARRMAGALGLPLIELDRVFWRPGWIQTPGEVFREAVVRLTGSAAWIMDGNYGDTYDLRMPAADTVVFLDLPRGACMYRVVMRTILGYGRTRPGLPPECPERFDREFLNYVWNFRFRHRPRIIAALAKHAGHAQVHHLESRGAVERFQAMIERR